MALVKGFINVSPMLQASINALGARSDADTRKLNVMRQARGARQAE